MKKILSVILALAMLLSVTAVFADEAAPAAEEIPAEETAPAEEAPATEAAPAKPVLLVTVNGKEIYDNNHDIEDLVDYYSQMYEQNGIDMSSAEMQAYLKSLGLEWAIQTELYRQKAEADGVGQTTDEQKAAMEQEARDGWNAIVESYMSSYYGITDESSEEEKASARSEVLSMFESYYHYTEDSYVAEAVENGVFTAMMNAVRDEFTVGIDVTEDEIVSRFNELVEEDKESYEGNVLMYEYYTNYGGATSHYIPEGYRGVTHILLKVDDALLQTYKDLSAALEEQQEAETADETAGAEEEDLTDGEPLEIEVEPLEIELEPVGDDESDGEPLEIEVEPIDEEPAEEEEVAEEPAEEEPAEEPKEPVTQEQVDAARQAVLDSVQPTIDEIMQKFSAGTPFADLIAEYGTDPGMQDETNKALGYAVHKDSILWDPVFTEAAMSIANIGEVSEPVVGSYGVHILYYLRDIPAGAVDMTAEIRDSIREELLDDKQSEVIDAAMEKLREAADIQYSEAGQALKDGVEALLSAAEEDGAEEGDLTPEEEPAEEAGAEEEIPADGAEPQPEPTPAE